jgi:peptidoglycan/LPS O-acetylase OafA/YrhL
MKQQALSTPATFSSVGDVKCARDSNLDFVKGLLVLVMVLYHTMNIFTTASDAYQYIRFVSGSFILLSGYIVARVYQPRFAKNSMQTSQRLLSRGIKLLVIFTLLNVLASLGSVRTGKSLFGVESYLADWPLIYGIGSPRGASFQILLPIAYLLLAAPLLLRLAPIRKWFLAAAMALAFALSFAGFESVNIGFFAIGLIGVAVGMLVSAMRRPFFIESRSLLAALLLVVVAWMRTLEANTLTYALAIGLVVKLLYDFSRMLDMRHIASRAVLTLGVYSLVCYIAQLVVLHGVSAALGHPHWDLGYEAIVIFAAVGVALVAGCRLLTLLRRRFELVDATYRHLLT